VPNTYRYPYIDSSVFIAVVNKETVKGVNRGQIGYHVLRQAEQGLFKVGVCPYTYAECFKMRRGDRQSDQSQDLIIEYLSNYDVFHLVDVDRSIGKHANSLSRTYGIMPTDAIHVACALRAGCDKFLTWDEDLPKLGIPGIDVEEPAILGQTYIDIS
jgi:predicted nucleic acid-binding protein